MYLSDNLQNVPIYDANGEIATSLISSEHIRGIKGVYNPRFGNIPKEPYTHLYFRDTLICTPGNIAVIVAAPSVGKTGICGAIIASSSCTAGADTLGFALTSLSGVAYIDTEQSRRDVYLAEQRINKRRGFNDPDTQQTVFHETYGIRELPLSDESALLGNYKYSRKSLLFKILDDNYDAVVIDGISDFVNNVNDETECNRFINELLAKIEMTQTIVVTTLHVNPKDEKPRGHLGSELLRRCYSALYAGFDNDVRKITTEFAFSKLRSSNTHNTVYYTYSSSEEMFVQCEPKKSQPKYKEDDKETEIHNVLTQLSSEKTSWAYTELVNVACKCNGKSESTWKTYIRLAQTKGWVTKDEYGKYIINVSVK